MLLIKADDVSAAPFSLALQKSTQQLHKVVIELNQYIESLKDIVEKFAALSDLSQFSFDDSTVSDSSAVARTTSNSSNSKRCQQLQVLKVLLDCYEEQTELNFTVSENIGTASSLEQTVYYVCIWTHQPAIGQEAFIAERQLSLMLDTQ